MEVTLYLADGRVIRGKVESGRTAAQMVIWQEGETYRLFLRNPRQKGHYREANASRLLSLVRDDIPLSEAPPPPEPQPATQPAPEDDQAEAHPEEEYRPSTTQTAPTQFGRVDRVEDVYDAYQKAPGKPSTARPGQQ